MTRQSGSVNGGDGLILVRATWTSRNTTVFDLMRPIPRRVVTIGPILAGFLGVEMGFLRANRGRRSTAWQGVCALLDRGTRNITALGTHYEEGGKNYANTYIDIYIFVGILFTSFVRNDLLYINIDFFYLSH